MRPAGIIAPTLNEAEALLGMLLQREEFVIQGKQFHKGVLKRKDVCLCLCGIGKTNAAHGTALLLERFQPAIVYIIGVAGAYPSSGLNVGDIAVGDKEIYGDEGLLLNLGFITMDAIGLPLATAEGKRYYNEFPLHVPAELADYRHNGAFVTVSSCTGTLHRGRELEKSFNALCENMEGAAIAHICLLHGIPVVEIRGISNLIEDRECKPLDKAAIMEASEKVQQFFMDRVL
ncbi:MAG: futalosine hydrolase [Dissulfurispiraceae bacterium]